MTAAVSFGRVPQIQEFFRIRGVEPHEGDVHKSQYIRETTIQHRSPEFGEVRVARAAGIYRRGDAVIEANERIYAVKISFVPMAMEIDESRTDVLAGDIAYVQAAGRVKAVPDPDNAAAGDANVRSLV